MELEIIEKQLVNYFKSSNFEFEKLSVSSKNEIFKVIFQEKKYLLKVFKFKEGFVKKQNSISDSFERETFALNNFSNFEEVPKILISKKEKSFFWYLTDFFEGVQLKGNGNINLYKKAIDFLVKIHSLNVTKKSNSSEILTIYQKKIEEAKFRLESFLQIKYYDKKLYNILNNFERCFKIIEEESNCIIHGDFVDRNILVDNNQILVLDWENSRIAPPVEDLVFFVDSLKISDNEKNKLIDYYNSKLKTNYPNQTYYILDLLMQFRLLGTIVRIKKDEIEKHLYKIEEIKNKIYGLADLLKSRYEIDLIE